MYTQLDKGKESKLRLNFKIICLTLPFIIGIAIYYTIKDDKPKDKPNAQIRITQNSSDIPYFYISIYEECSKELMVIIDNITQSFELPRQYPFSYTKCNNNIRQNTIYTYQIQNNQFILNNLISISSVQQYIDNTEIIFKLLNGSQIINWDERIQYAPIYYIKNSNNQFFILQINTSAKIYSKYNEQLLLLKVFGGRIIIKFFISNNNNPEDAIKQFHRYIGGYKLFPLWTMGLHINGNSNQQIYQTFIKQDLIQWIDENQNSSLLNNITLMKITRPTKQNKEIEKQYLIKSNNSQPYIGCYNNKLVNYIDYNQQYAIYQEDQINNIKNYSGFILKQFENYQINQTNQQCTNKKQNFDQQAYHYSKKSYLLNGHINEQFFHSLNTFSQAKQYKDYLQSQLLLSEQIFFGTGQFSGHIFESQDIELTISRLLYSGLIGIPFLGSYGCDFIQQNITQCTKQLSIQAWMPIFVIQNTQIFQINDYQNYFNSIQHELHNRVKFIKWMFTQFIKNYDITINMLTGTIIQPIWWLDINDQKAYQFQTTEFLYGKDLLIVPLIQEPTNEYQEITPYQIYFPKGYWWMSAQSLFQGGQLIDVNISSYTNTPIFQRSGSIIFKQDTQNIDIYNNTYQLEVVFEKNENEGYAEGQMITISNLTQENVENKCLNIKHNCLMILKIRFYYDSNNHSEQYYLQVKKSSINTIFEEIKINQIITYHSKMAFSRIINFEQPIIINEEFKYEYLLQQHYY